MQKLATGSTVFLAGMGVVLMTIGGLMVTPTAKAQLGPVESFVRTWLRKTEWDWWVCVAWGAGTKCKGEDDFPRCNHICRSVGTIELPCICKPSVNGGFPPFVYFGCTCMPLVGFLEGGVPSWG